MLVVCWSGDTAGQMLVTLSGRGDIGQAVVSESANQVSDQLTRCGEVRRGAGRSYGAMVRPERPTVH